MRVAVLSSDKTYWALGAFMHQYNKYWDKRQPVMIAGYSQPPAPFPENFSFYCIGKFSGYPVDKWSNGLINFLMDWQYSHIILLLDDYWMRSPVDLDWLQKIWDYTVERRSIARFDVTAYPPESQRDFEDYSNIAGNTILRSTGKNPCHFSYQASIWNVNHLLSVLVPNETPWQSELEGNTRLLKRTDLTVLRTRKHCVEYLIASQHGNIVLDGGYQGKDKGLTQEDLNELRSTGTLPELQPV